MIFFHFLYKIHIEVSGLCNYSLSYRIKDVGAGYVAVSEDEFQTLPHQGVVAASVEETGRVLASVLARFPGRVAVISSFGAESAVLLAQIAAQDKAVPVFFLDTGRHFPETLAYRDELSQHLGLEDVRTLQPARKEVEYRDPEGQLVAFDPDACCALRKVEPLDVVLPEFDIWVTGRKRMQAATRAALPVAERQADGSVKLNPLAGWSEAQIADFMKEKALPAHPLVARGYRSIGCEPCTRPVGAGEDSRAGRWAGLAKTECGLHRPVPVTPPPGADKEEISATALLAERPVE